MAEADLRNMVMNFRVSDLQVLLGFAGRNKTGKKQELQSRALDLLKIKSHAVEAKIRELHNRRYNNSQLHVRPGNYEIPDRALTDRQVHHYDPHMNSNYSPRMNPSMRPSAPLPQAPSFSFSHSSSNKAYVSTPHPNASASQHYRSYVDVKFKDMPFYDTLYVLTRPSGLVSEVNDRLQETSLYFTLTPEQAQEVAISRKENGNYECQILLRFCVLDISCEQEDAFPPQCNVNVNNKSVTLPNPIPTNRPGIEAKRPSKPVNITSFSKLSPTVTNVVSISWTSTYGRSYAAGLFISHHLNSNLLLQRLKNNGVRNPAFTTTMIQEKLQAGQDAEIATTSLRGSLICPLGKIKMQLPCRAMTCSHLQCFDASLYIQMNEKKSKWVCPVCDKPAIFKTLALDGLFMEIVSKVPSECTEVQFHEDGSWTLILPTKDKDVKTEKRVKKDAKPVVVVDLSDSDSEDTSFKKKADSPPLISSPTCSFPSPSSQNFMDHPASPPFNLTPPLLPLPPASAFNPISKPFSYPLAPFPNSLRAANPDQGNHSESMSILPDLGSTSHTENPFPSTSTGIMSDSGTFPDIQFFQDPSFLPHMSTFGNLPDIDPTASTSGHSYSNFDFLSLLQGSDITQESSNKLKENSDFTDVIPID